jgi:hypothetical protein
MNYSELVRRELDQQLEVCEENIIYHLQMSDIHEDIAVVHQEQLLRLHKWKDKLLMAIQLLNEAKLPVTPPRDAEYQILLESEDL